MITNSLSPDRLNMSAALKIGVIAALIIVATLGGVLSLGANLTTTYAVANAAPN